MTIRKRAELTVSDWSKKSGVLSPDGTYFKMLVDVVEDALKDQANLTRNRCAGKINTLAMDDATVRQAVITCLNTEED